MVGNASPVDPRFALHSTGASLSRFTLCDRLRILIFTMLEQKSNKNLPEGGRIRLFHFVHGAQKSLADFMGDVVWGCELPDADVALLKERFSGIGLDFEKELLKRGRPLPPSPKSIKTDYGDLAEVVGYYIETEVDGTDPKYMWARNVHNKTVSRVSLPGIQQSERDRNREP